MLLIITNRERDKRSFKFFSSHRIVFISSTHSLTRVCVGGWVCSDVVVTQTSSAEMHASLHASQQQQQHQHDKLSYTDEWDDTQQYEDVEPIDADDGPDDEAEATRSSTQHEPFDQLVNDANPGPHVSTATAHSIPVLQTQSRRDKLSRWSPPPRVLKQVDYDERGAEGACYRGPFTVQPASAPASVLHADARTGQRQQREVRITVCIAGIMYRKFVTSGVFLAFLLVSFSYFLGFLPPSLKASSVPGCRLL